VQEAFLAFVRVVPGPEAGKHLAYLRRTVINLAHGHHRRTGSRQLEELQ
jgi:DNA-directed RNA polymerase specialized sigma24 family protein